MPVSLRRRALCAHCHSRCQATPLEVMLRGGNGWKGHWTWWTIVLCPACRPPLLDALGAPQLQVDDVDELQELAPPRRRHVLRYLPPHGN